jgi:hypothetical protein
LPPAAPSVVTLPSAAVPLSSNVTTSSASHLTTANPLPVSPAGLEDRLVSLLPVVVPPACSALCRDG